ncbi:PQQ-binding-like beta-propeller repeat protein [bacterium]|nr:PQQ-binding-like beta-propeller repeat protein [bacterium]
MPTTPTPGFRPRALIAASIAALALSACAPRPPAEVADAASEPHPGQAVFERACASCHDNPEDSRAPATATLRQMRPMQIFDAMIAGRMRPQAAGLSPTELDQVASYLGVAEGLDDAVWINAMACPADRAAPKLDGRVNVAGFGFDKSNARNLSAEQSGLTRDDMASLELAWAMAFPASTTMRGQPAVVGDTLFLPVTDIGRVLAIDVAGETPCIEWSYDAGGPLRTSAGFGERSDGKKVIIVGDTRANVHMIDASNGAPLWKTRIGLFDASLSTGTPVLHGDRVYAPVSQYEIMIGAENAYECCKTHGAVRALDALTGEIDWTANTMPDAQPVRDRGDGQMIWGPSGAPIWNSPSLDPGRGLLFVGTGEATSEPAHENTNAILGIDLESGDIRWSMQATARDIYLAGCGPNPKPEQLNCTSDTVYEDVDFGASTIFGKRPDGSDVVLAGQKSGAVWAINPDDGKVIFKRPIGTGSAMGGIHWGIAYNGRHVFAPISNPGRGPEAEGISPGLYAVNVMTGKIDWRFDATPDCADGRDARIPQCARLFGFSGAPTVIDEAVVTGSLDGKLRAFDAKTGDVLWSFDTVRDYETVNGIPGKGGTIDGASIVAVDGMVFVNSGYGMFGQAPGNVLLAFKPKAS